MIILEAMKDGEMTRFHISHDHAHELWHQLELRGYEVDITYDEPPIYEEAEKNRVARIMKEIYDDPL